ncbi:uncharacterized protein ACR2FA_009986 [Aphomia sociella]
MSKDSELPCHLCTLPTEVILYIFSYLPAKDLTRCRRVCIRWKLIVDRLARSDLLWRDYCKKDFNSTYKIARLKSRCGLVWYNIYRSLTLWSRLPFAKETQDEFASASCFLEEIRDFTVLRDGVIGVQTRSSITYYDIETLERSQRGPIRGDYARYTENEHTIVILGYQLHLFIVRKIIKNPCFEQNTTFDNVKTFLLIDKHIYFVNMNDEIFICNLEDNILRGRLIKRTIDGVMSFGFTDRLHVLTLQRNIYTLVDDDLVLSYTLEENSNLLHQFREYNFLESMDWRVYIQWMYILNHTFPQGPLRDIIIIRPYGDVFFVGSNWGVLRIYYAPYKSGELDLFNSEPVKQYNFTERCDCPVLSMCPILQVDVLEAEDGHTVIVAMPKKIAVLNFTHNFKRTASVAMLPYADIQKVKLLKIDDNKYCKKINETPKNKNDSSDNSKKSENLKPEKETPIRRPIIKTITFKNDSTKIYKAVTFVDQRKQQATPVQIDIPNDGCKKPKVKSESSKIRMKASISRVSVKEKAVRRRTEHKKREKFKHARSPDLSVEIRSPPTEVAKWAPSSINSHTKQYYEAWVDTTLAAISKKSKKDKLFWEKHHFMETFQRALAERPVSPDLIYENLADERYTGRIKVRHR